MESLDQNSRLVSRATDDLRGINAVWQCRHLPQMSEILARSQIKNPKIANSVAVREGLRSGAIQY